MHAHTRVRARACVRPDLISMAVRFQRTLAFLSFPFLAFLARVLSAIMTLRSPTNVRKERRGWVAVWIPHGSYHGEQASGEASEQKYIPCYPAR